MSKHIEIRVNIKPVWAEYVSEILLNACGCAGVVMEEKQVKDDVVIAADIEVIKGYLPVIGDFDVSKISQILQLEREQLLLTGIPEENLGSWEVETREVLDEEWAHSWKKYWHPMKIGSKIVICPSWENYTPAGDENLIWLDPGSAFGTGTHPTTRLCVQALEKLLCRNELQKGEQILKRVQDDENAGISIADIGMGSGILAIAGIKLGAGSVVGVDNDASVVSVAKENAEKNDVDDKCKFFAGSASNVEGKYGLVVANILAEVIVEIMPDLEKLVDTDGKMVLSGIISRKFAMIEEALEKVSFKVEEVLQEEDWVAVIASRKQS